MMPISSNSKNFAVHFLVLSAVAVLTLVILAPDAMDESNLGLALRVTARLAFVIPSDPVYLTIGALMILAVMIRVTAFAKRMDQSTAAMDSAR